MLKAVYNKEKKTKNLVTTITGLITLLISGLCLFGILTAEQGAGLGEYATMIVTAVAGIISIFKAEDGENIVLPKAGKKGDATVNVYRAVSRFTSAGRWKV